jgi:uncharacterized protein YcbX
LPDGDTVMSDQPDVDESLSQALKARVNLTMSAPEKPSYEEYWPDVEGRANREKMTEESMPPRSFFDGAPIHLLTTATLDRLRELYPEGRFEARRYRPNIVIEPSQPVKDFVENGWVNRTLRVGDEGVKMRITTLCSRCVMTTLPQGDLPRDLGVLRTAARHNHVNVGAYASVIHEGKIKRGDSVWLE